MRHLQVALAGALAGALVGSPALAQPAPDRLQLRGAAPAAAQVAFVMTGVRATGLGASFRLDASGPLTTRGDTMVVRVAPGEPAVIWLPAGAFRAEFHAVAGGELLSAEVVSGREPARVHLSARGAVLHVVRDSVGGAVMLGPAAGSPR